MNDVEFVKIFKFSLNFGTKKDFVLSNINSNVVSDSIGLILICFHKSRFTKKYIISAFIVRANWWLTGWC